MHPPGVGVFRGAYGLEVSTRQKGVEVSYAGGIAQGSQLLKTCFQRCCCGPAGGRSSPSWPSKHKRFDLFANGVCYTQDVQQNKLSSRIKISLFITLGTLALGIILLVTGLNSLYGDVNNCGFGAPGNCQNPNTHSSLAVAGEYIAGVSFVVSMVLLVVFLIVRAKE